MTRPPRRRAPSAPGSERPPSPRGLAARLAVSAALVLLPASGAGQAMPVDTFTLENGLRVVVAEDRSTPVVAVSVWYRAGSDLDPEGVPGVARIAERLLVHATGHVGPGEMEGLVRRAGGVLEASGDRDRISVGEVLPSHRLNLALWLQAERMARLRVDASTVEAARGALEVQLRRDRAGGMAGRAESVMDTLARPWAPGRRPVLPTEEELRAVRPEDVARFHRRFLGPGNAVLVVVGDVTTSEARRLVEEYLGAVPARGEGTVAAGPLPEPVPAGGEERRVVVEEPGARLPVVRVAYTVPPARHPDRHALELLAEVLGAGGPGRLRERLVRREEAAAEVAVRLETGVGPGLLHLAVLTGDGGTAEEVEALLHEEVARLGEEEVAPREMRRALNARRVARVTEGLTVWGRAGVLQRAMLYHGDPFRLEGKVARYEAVEPADLRRVARRWLVPENRTVVVARPPDGAGSGRGQGDP